MGIPAIGGSVYGLLVCIAITGATPLWTDDRCIKACPELKPDMLNVHLICHTHDDMGWLKTVDEYYIGSKQRIQRAGVQYIIDSVVENLLLDPSRRFIYVETGFFWMWWNEQTERTKDYVKELVTQGRLEFIGGGWSMNDEGTTHYTAIIDQLTWGFRRLKDIFGDCAIPRIGWQIDPFGHSREQASIFAQMGFDGLFLGRVDSSDKWYREKSKTLEFLWKASPNLGKAADIFTGILYNLYQPPDGFCFDILCNDEPIQDDPNRHGYNVDRRVQDFLSVINEQASKYDTNNIMITMGNDFFYQQAGMWYNNLDKLIKHINAMQVNGSKINLFYSTPSCYLEALHAANKKWTTKSDDFFPYASDYSRYWVGYFTSRPSQKLLVRKTNNLLQICKQLDTLARLGPSEHVTILREIMGILQHHDAITGTSKQVVADDYMQRLSEGIEAGKIVLNDAYKKLMTKSEETLPNQELCQYLNVSICGLTQTSRSFAVTVYNPLAHPRVHHVRFPVDDDFSYIVHDPDENIIPSQLVPVPQAVVEEFAGAYYDLVFDAHLPPLGFKTYFVKQTKASSDRKSQNSTVISPKDKKVILANEFLQVEIDGKTGLLKTVTNLKEKLVLPMTQRFLYYPTDRSGVYAMRTEKFRTIYIGKHAKIKLIKGDLVQEVHQTFGPWASQVIRLYNNSREVEFEWMIGPIPTDGGHEVITRFETNLENEGVFYTDSNGREMIERVRDHRDTWKVDVRNQPVAGNYYPVNSRIFLQDEDEDIQMTLLTDRSEGGSSIQEGNLELMIHRRITSDDGGGTYEGVNEWGENGGGLVARGKTQLLVDRIAKAAPHHRQMAQQIFMAPCVTFAENRLKPSTWNKLFRSQFSAVNTSLPANVHLLTLEQWKGQSILIRLEHFYEKTDDPWNLSQPATVNLKELLPFTLTKIEEMSLGGNILLFKVNRLRWKTLYNNQNLTIPPSEPSDDPFVITLSPMQIRTFILTVEESGADDVTERHFM